MTFRKTEIREGAELFVDSVGHLVADAMQLAHALIQPPASIAPSSRGNVSIPWPDAIGPPRRRETRNVDGHLHQLFLEQRNTQRAFEGLLAATGGHRTTVSSLLRRRIYGMDRSALDRTGTDQRHLDHQVVEFRGFSRGSVAICARDSTWNTPTESARCNISYTAVSARSRCAKSTVDRRCVRPPGPSCSAGRRACRGPVDRTSPDPPQHNRPCPTAGRCGWPSAPTPPGTRRRWDGHRSPFRRSGYRGAVDTLRSARPARGPDGDIGPAFRPDTVHRLTCLLHASCWPWAKTKRAGHVPHR